MKFTIEFLARARKEFLDSWDWYEDKQPGLGDRFLNEVDKIINQIEKTPERYPQRKKKFREAPVNIFPYLIIYQINKQKKIIVINSIFHTSQNPRKKYTGLKKA